MGIHNRDYIRDDRPDEGGFYPSAAGQWPVWKKIIAISAVAFILQIAFPAFDRIFSLNPSDVLQRGFVWQLLTYAFLHDPYSIFHILFNMLLLFMFGKRMESMYGSREFGFFYCTSAIFAGGCFLLWGLAMQQTHGAIGASGAVLALLILYALKFPREIIRPFGLFDVEMRWVAVFLIAIDAVPLLLGPTGGDRVAHSVHLGGALFAYLYHRFNWRISSLFGSVNSRMDQWKGQQKVRRSKLKIYRDESDEEMEANVDRILEKVSQQGESSLTKKERKVLEQASQKYKNRQS